MQTAGFVLVGGNSSRFGRDKAKLPLSSRLLVQAIALQVKDAAGSVTLVGQPDRYSDLGIECLADCRPGMGPLSGIEAALSARRGELNLIVACDMPGVPSEWLRALIECARATEACCTLAQDETGTVHPLLAVYRSRCLPFIQQALDQGRSKLMDAVAAMGVSTIPVGGPVWNINTPQDWDAWQEHTTRERVASRE